MQPKGFADFELGVDPIAPSNKVYLVNPRYLELAWPKVVAGRHDRNKGGRARARKMTILLRYEWDQPFGEAHNNVPN